MNILYVCHSLNIGGAQKISVETAIEMKKRGHSIYVASPKGELVQGLLKYSIKYFEVNINSQDKTIISFIAIFFRLLHIVVKYKIEVIHTIHRWPNFICFFICAVTNTKLIWTDHNILVGNRFLTLYKDRVISVSNVGKKHLVKYFHIPQEKITVIYNAVRPPIIPSKDDINNFLNEIGFSKNEKILCTIANLVERKGHKDLLEAIPIVLSRMQGVHFLFAGNGHLKQDLMILSKELKISAYVHFLGQREDISTILGASDAMVLPSLWEGFPLVILEAFSLSKPVIATNVGGNKELILDGETGFIVEARDHKMLADSIIKMLSDEKKCKEMGARAKEYVNQKFDFDKMISEIEKVYKTA